MPDSTSSTIAPRPDRIIHLSVRLDQPALAAFRYFVDEDLLASWLTAAARVEPSVGGRYELFWEPADRENNSTIGCRITAIEPGQLLAFQWRSPKRFKSFANAADPLTHVTVAFSAEGTGARVHLVHSGWRSADEWEEARVWQERAWRGAIAALQQLVNR